ncbi:sporulation protein YunB [Brevibacillus ginsengisoli]|uniref:sporulation protein YunB n=1 Tax=Brevibacillus ginsengisoli TaxID=363854 RepID=UPI003CEB9FDF
MTMLIVIVILLVITFFLAEKRIEPTLLLIATQKTDQLAKQAMADSVTKRIVQQGVDFNQIVNVRKDNQGKIQALEFNFKEYARIVGETTSRIQNSLKEYEEDKVQIHIPLGVATKSVFLEHFGPEIPVSFMPIGSVRTRLETDVKEAGINMVLATVYIFVETDLRIVIPFATEQQTVTTRIPITESLIVGNVPQYLYNDPSGKPNVPVLKGK